MGGGGGGGRRVNRMQTTAESSCELREFPSDKHRWNIDTND